MFPTKFRNFYLLAHNVLLLLRNFEHVKPRPKKPCLWLQSMGGIWCDIFLFVIFHYNSR